MFQTRHLRVVFAAVVAGAVLSSLVGYTTASSASSRHFRFVAVGQVGTTPAHIIFTGDGAFDNTSALGGGSYTEFGAVGSPPFPVKSAGTWDVTQRQSFTLVGTYGDLMSGILVMKVVLIQNIPSPAIRFGTLTVYCNIGVANLSTGFPEGIQLQLPFETFTPSIPATTSFSTTSE